MRWCLVLVVALGCKSKSSGAQEMFANKLSCPEDQVTVTPRPDLDAAEELAPDFSAKQPSDEVKADPARLAKWQADQDESREKWMSGYSDYDMFEVSGCGHTMILGCHRISGRNNTSSAGQVSCDEPREQAKREHDEKKAARKKAREDAKAAKKAAKEARDK